MYTPKAFLNEDGEEAFQFMELHPFATVISVSEGAPLISHLPLTPQKLGDQITLIGHLARGNPHSKILSKEAATVIFQGAHTYVTPEWYAEHDVPTWNYLSLHAIGTVELVEDYDGLIDCLKKLTVHAEKYWPSGWDFEVSEDLKDPKVLTRSILGFKIKVEQITFKKKLNQNRSLKDQENVIVGLSQRKDDNSRDVMNEMIRNLRGKKP